MTGGFHTRRSRHPSYVSVPDRNPILCGCHRPPSSVPQSHSTPLAQGLLLQDDAAAPSITHSPLPARSSTRYSCVEIHHHAGSLTDSFSPVLVSNPCFLGWIHALLDSVFCSRKPKSFCVLIASDSVACGLFLGFWPVE